MYMIISNVFLNDMVQYGKMHFAMVMDETSLQRLATLAEVIDALHPVSAEGADRVVAESVNAEAIGSEHLRYIMSGKGYKIRPKLCGYIIQAFWKIYFDHSHPLKPRLILPILQGDHNEKGIIVSYKKVFHPQCNGQAPLIVPHVGTSQYYVYHLGATEKFFEGLATWASKSIGGNTAIMKKGNGIGDDGLPFDYSSTLYKDMQIIADGAWKRTVNLISNHGELEKFTVSLSSYEGW